MRKLLMTVFCMSIIFDLSYIVLKYDDNWYSYGVVSGWVLLYSITALSYYSYIFYSNKTNMLHVNIRNRSKWNMTVCLIATEYGVLPLIIGLGYDIDNMIILGLHMFTIFGVMFIVNVVCYLFWVYIMHYDGVGHY